jgi:hypothetical protein
LGIIEGLMGKEGPSLCDVGINVRKKWTGTASAHRLTMPIGLRVARLKAIQIERSVLWRVPIVLYRQVLYGL